MVDDMRGQADERRRLLHELEVERNQLMRNVETCRIRDIDHPFIDQWSLKDIVGHVASWEAEVVTALREVREGRRPALLDFEEATLDHWNQDHVERKRDLNFWSVLEQLRGGRQRLLEEVARFTEDELTGDSSMAEVLIRSTIDHDREHWHEIAARLAGMPGVRGSHSVSVPGETRVAAS